jgi:hypothetical protein
MQSSKKSLLSKIFPGGAVGQVHVKSATSTYARAPCAPASARKVWTGSESDIQDVLQLLRLLCVPESSCLISRALTHRLVLLSARRTSDPYLSLLPHELPPLPPAQTHLRRRFSTRIDPPQKFHCVFGPIPISAWTHVPNCYQVRRCILCSPH